VLYVNNDRLEVALPSWSQHKYKRLENAKVYFEIKE
jgi:hypothetical protein